MTIVSQEELDELNKLFCVTFEQLYIGSWQAYTGGGNYLLGSILEVSGKYVFTVHAATPDSFEFDSLEEAKQYVVNRFDRSFKPGELVRSS